MAADGSHRVFWKGAKFFKKQCFNLIFQPPFPRVKAAEGKSNIRRGSLKYRIIGKKG